MLFSRFFEQCTKVALLALAPAAFADFDPELHEQVKPMEAEDSLASMVVQDGYRLELVASEPMVEEPVLFEFDGNGRMYVAEMLTYMQDADRTGTMQSTSRIKRLEDLDGDGVMDTFTIFADNLLLPRMILTLEDGRILVRETNTLDLLLIEDTDGDGVADKRSVFYKGGRRGGNLEHQPSGLLWSIDNWIYETYTKSRYRIDGEGMRTEETLYGGGQWGLTQDAAGRLYYSTAGGEDPAFGFQFPIVYGRVVVEDEQAKGFREVFPLDQTPDVQGGLKRLRDDNTLNKFTGVGGQSIYLGDAMPELQGNLFLPEPVGNLIRRAEVNRENGYTQLTHPYQDEKKEFIATRDANFRPVWSGTTPDGGLMFVDMYRGIIQEGNWTKKGSYLREVIDKYGFDRNIGRGRIYRLTRDGAAYGEQPRFYGMRPQEMVSALSHPNGWWRMTAQKLIVLSQDLSVVEALKRKALSDENALGRLHSLWTLEGLGAIDEDLLTKLMLNDSDSDVRSAAVRISEALVKEGNEDVLKLWVQIAKGDDVELSQQVLLSLFYLDKSEDLRNEIREYAQARNPEARGLAAIEEHENWIKAEQEREAQMAALGEEFSEAYAAGQTIYRTLCYTCHGEDGTGVALPDGSKLAPSLADSPRVKGGIGTLARIIRDGLQGPIDGKTYGGGVMAGMGSNGDAWVANVLTYLRAEYGDLEQVVREEQIAKVASLDADRSEPWTLEELVERYGKRLVADETWEVSASSGEDRLSYLLDGDTRTAWQGDEGMVSGQWLQVEFPEPRRLSRIVLNSGRSKRDFARAFRVEYSQDGDTWELLEENEVGQTVSTVEALGLAARFIKVTLLAGPPERRWAVNELELYGSKTDD
ncbi:discoidin domain-containing protein [Pelagicoccus sp. SDUM812005]|uniref:DUF7133 domain-containing protein n=1 Tax=Pelagicoccus sp. SDUM812005 TaxID=3041257 RepID=UPI00280C4443|nr:discoidin domain-containing protein [Pelagicoccus sp. SDUM812005]MDQ8182929.1 discoidin domain-containing protein [Pelagicoccus sp. SDUM812005]